MYYMQLNGTLSLHHRSSLIIRLSFEFLNSFLKEYMSRVILKVSVKNVLKLRCGNICCLYSSNYVFANDQQVHLSKYIHV